MNTLQRLIGPNLEVCSEEALYLRMDARAWADLHGQRLHFLEGGLASTDTFYNGLSVATWRGHCDIRSVVLSLQGEGRFVLNIGVHRRGRASVWLSDATLHLQPDTPQHVPVPGWEALDDGIVFFRLRALGPGRLDGAAYLTPDLPRNDVQLGIVITHFNRVAQVMPAIERIRATLLERPDVQGRITLTVVDNSGNLPIESGPHVQRIRNRNLGGTGGFVRGLLALTDSGCHTHALFMDDDASCETESIARCLALLRHARDARLAVAGALLRELAPWHLLEKGARFDGQVRAIAGGLDMRSVEHLLIAERPAESADYGAWWFFAFPLAEVRQYPFPFFVRGDDIQFGLANRFCITTMNGVACFGEDFSAKHSPLTAYLDARYHAVLALLDPRQAASRLFWVATRLFLKPLTSYHYTSAHAVTLALQHCLRGPGFFRDNLDMAAVRAEIAGLSPNEKLQPVDRGSLQLRGSRRRPESRLRRLGRLFSLQGFLLPNGLLMNRMTVQDKAFHGNASAVFRYRRVLYEHAPSRTGYIVEYDRRRFFHEIGAFLGTWATLMRRLPELRRAYRDGVPPLASERFWREVYGLAPRDLAQQPQAPRA